MTIVSISNGVSTSSLIVPDGSPSYGELREERDRLLRENAKLIDEINRLTQRQSDLWQTIEDIAVGATLDCGTCGKRLPCCCDKSKP